MVNEEAASIKNRALSLLKERGILKFIWAALRYILRKTIRLDWHKVYILKRSLHEPIQPVTPKVKVKIEQVKQDNIYKFKDIVDEDKYRRFQVRLSKGRACFAALDGEKAAGLMWASFEDEYDTDTRMEVKLNDKEVYLYDAYVTPEYRANSLNAAILAEEMKYLSNQGYNKATILIDAGNASSLKAIKAAGYYPENTVTILTILGMRFRRQREFTGPFTP